MRYTSRPLLEHAPSIRRIDTIYLVSIVTRGEYMTLDVAINLQANEHETEFEVTFQ